MEMGHCKDCRFWEQHNDTQNKTWNTCNVADWVEYDEKIADDAIAYYADAHDDSGLDAGIKTGPLFGCIQFQQRHIALGGIGQ